MANITWFLATYWPEGKKAKNFVLLLILTFSFILRTVNIDADIPFAQNADDIGDEGYWIIGGRDLVLNGSFFGDSNFYQSAAGGPGSAITYWLISKISGSTAFWTGRWLTAVYSTFTLLLGTAYFFRIHSFNSAVIFASLFGLSPVMVFYSRIYHLEFHYTFYVFVAFMLLVKDRYRPWRLVLAGVVCSIAVAVKVIAIIYVIPVMLFVAIKHWGKWSALRDFLIGAMPLSILYAGWLFKHHDEFAPTVKVLQSYHSGSATIFSRSTANYFWFSKLVIPLLPWFGLSLMGAFRSIFSLRKNMWVVLWLLVPMLFLILKPYPTFARLLLLVIPGIFISAIALEQFPKFLIFKGRHYRRIVIVLCPLTCFISTLYLGKDVYFNPSFCFKQASARVAALTSSKDHVIGPHAHSLTSLARYTPLMSLPRERWHRIDPIDQVTPTIVIESRVYNGHRESSVATFYNTSMFSSRQYLGSISYHSNRFHFDLYRVFPSSREAEAMRQFQAGHESPYDGIIYMLSRPNLNLGCYTKAVQVAESRGDPYISHLKVARSSGCLGMYGLSYSTATSDQCKYWIRKVARSVPAIITPLLILDDDRFNPELATSAAQGYLEFLESMFSQYSDKTAFVFASYNAGPYFIKGLIRQTKIKDPSWSEDILPLLLSCNVDEMFFYANWETKRIRHKFTKEIPLYVEDALNVYTDCAQCLN